MSVTPMNESLVRNRTVILWLALLAVPLLGQGVSVSFQGKVVDGQGRGIAGAKVWLVETQLTAPTGAHR